MSYLSNYGRMLLMRGAMLGDLKLIYYSAYLVVCFLGLTVDNLFYRCVCVYVGEVEC